MSSGNWNSCCTPRKLHKPSKGQCTRSWLYPDLSPNQRSSAQLPAGSQGPAMHTGLRQVGRSTLVFSPYLWVPTSAGSPNAGKGLITAAIVGWCWIQSMLAGCVGELTAQSTCSCGCWTADTPSTMLGPICKFTRRCVPRTKQRRVCR